MSFDIYGQNLRPGFCEVHPNVAERYPCSLCVMDADRAQALQREEAAYLRDLSDAYYRDMEADYVESIENTDGDGI